MNLFRTNFYDSWMVRFKSLIGRKYEGYIFEHTYVATRTSDMLHEYVQRRLR